MLMEVHCPSCGMRLRIDEKFAGRKGRCPNCRNKMIIPAVDDPGVVLLPPEKAGAGPAELPAEGTDAEPKAPAGETLYVPYSGERPRFTPPTIELIFREKVREFITTAPLWLLSLLAHTALFLFLMVTISLAPAKPVVRIPVMGRFIEAEPPKQMVPLPEKQEERPRVEDILTNATNFERSNVTRPTVAGDVISNTPMVGPIAPGGSPLGPPVIGFEVAGATGWGSLGTPGGRGFSPRSFSASQAQVGFFGNRGKKGAEGIIFVIDASVTMGQIANRFERAVAELRSSIEKLTPGHRFNIIFFSDQPIKWQEHMVIASPENKRAALEFVESMRDFKGSGTLPVAPMKEAMEDKPDVIFLLTDGDFLADDGSELVALSKEKKVRIYPIGFGDKVNEPLLQKLAETSGGIYTPAKM